MKLGLLNQEVAIYEIRERIGTLLSESISDYLSMTIAQLKNDKPVDLDKLAEIVAGLKVIGNRDHRESLTKDDIGINPNNVKELYSLLNAVSKDVSKSEKMVGEVFSSLKHIAPSMYKKTREEFKTFESGTKAEKEQLIQKISAFSTKVNQLFYKLRHGAAAPAPKQAPTDITNAYDNVGGAPI